MIHAHFEYRTPRDAAQAASILAQDPDGTRILGGGTWVVPEMSCGESRPRVVLDLARAGLNRIEATADGLRIGAMTTYAELLASDEVATAAPLLRAVAGEITGGWAIRNQGTLGGAVAAARPQSDVPGALVAAGAVAVVQGPQGARGVAVAELISGAMRTSLAPGEVMAAFELPRWSGGVGYVKLKRYASSWPIVTASAGVTVVGGRCTAARLVLGGATAAPLAVDVSRILVGQAIDRGALQAAERAAAAAVTDPWEDALAPGAYRSAVAGPVARRALTMACADETRGA